MLLSAYDGMKQREASSPVPAKRQLGQTLRTLVQLYEATGQFNQAVEWSGKLRQFDQAQANKPQQ